jgi:DNA-binding CsgD family transcriptional regulator
MTLADVAGVAATSIDLRSYRRAVLAIVRREVPFDAALYHSFSPTVPLETAVLEGLDGAVVARTLAHWDEFGSLFGAIRDRANRDGVATDAVLPRRARAAFLERVARPFGQRSLCMGHLIVRGRLVGAIALFARRSDGFMHEEVSTLRRLLPAVAAGDALHQLLDASPMVTHPTRLACTDQRLTGRQREVVEHVALGHTNAQIADAIGLSTHSVRNHLVRVFRTLGASNRADVVRLAVLAPVTPRARGGGDPSASGDAAGS